MSPIAADSWDLIADSWDLIGDNRRTNSKGSFMLGFFDGTERNAIDTRLTNEREIFVPFGSVGGYHRSFSIKLQLSFSTENLLECIALTNKARKCSVKLRFKPSRIATLQLQQSQSQQFPAQCRPNAPDGFAIFKENHREFSNQRL
uniref:Uncharacterized protein n=1 Tax=Romanomermis culicivorax TaxID=13658 RepID=A0A915K2U2_ROMCU